MTPCDGDFGIGALAKYFLNIKRCNTACINAMDMANEKINDAINRHFLHLDMVVDSVDSVDNADDDDGDDPTAIPDADT